MAVNKQNLAAIRHNYANAVFAHKVHEMASERKATRSNRYKVANVLVVIVVLAIFIVQSVAEASPVLGYIGAGLSAGEIMLLIVSLTFNNEPEIVSHKNTALKYMNLRDRYRSLIADMINGRMPDAETIGRRDDLLHEYQVISGLALATVKRDYKRAMDELKLKSDGQNTWSDRQIDSLLPLALRVKY